MMNQFEVKLLMYQFEVKEKRIEFVINNSLAQSDNFKIQHITLKVEKIAEITDFIFCEITGISPSLYLVLSEAYWKPSQSICQKWLKAEYR